MGEWDDDRLDLMLALLDFQRRIVESGVLGEDTNVYVTRGPIGANGSNPVVVNGFNPFVHLV